MDHRIVELLVLLMDEYGSPNLPVDRIDLISADLLGRGYTQHEINTALTWLVHRADDAEDESAQRVTVGTPAVTSHRLLNSFEQRYLSPAAFGQLLQLLDSRLIDLPTMERIIEYALASDFLPVGVEEIRLMVQSVLQDEDKFDRRSVMLPPVKLGHPYH